MSHSDGFREKRRAIGSRTRETCKLHHKHYRSRLFFVKSHFFSLFKRLLCIFLYFVLDIWKFNMTLNCGKNAYDLMIQLFNRITVKPRATLHSQKKKETITEMVRLPNREISTSRPQPYGGAVNHANPTARSRGHFGHFIIYARAHVRNLLLFSLSNELTNLQLKQCRMVASADKMMSKNLLREKLLHLKFKIRYIT